MRILMKSNNFIPSFLVENANCLAKHFKGGPSDGSVLLLSCRNGMKVKTYEEILLGDKVFVCKSISTQEESYFRTKFGFAKQRDSELQADNQFAVANVLFAVYEASNILSMNEIEPYVYCGMEENNLIRSHTPE